MAKFKTVRQREDKLEASLGKAFCFGDSPSAPTPPDPYKTADAQYQYNSKAAQDSAALSRYDQFTPYGSMTWTNNKTFDQAGYDKAMADWQAKPVTTASATGGPDYSGEATYDGLGNGPTGLNGITSPSSDDAPNKDDFYSGADNWSNKITLDPRVQALLDSQLATSQGLQGSIDKALSGVNSAFSHDINYGALPAAGSAQDALAQSAAGHTDITHQVEQAQGVAGQGAALASKAAQQWRQGMEPLSFDGVDKMWQPNDQTRQQVIDALYGQQSRTLDPQFAQQENQLRSTLMNRGITEGSEAWKMAMQNFEMAKNDAYQQARTSSLTGATSQMDSLARQGLAARQEGVGEATDLWKAPQTQAQNAMQFFGNAGSNLGNLTNTQSQQQDSIYRNANTAFGMQNTERQNALTEEQQKRVMALQYLSSLRGGATPQMPNFQAPNGPNVQPANYSGIVQGNYQGAQQQYGADVGSSNATTGAVAAIGAAAIPALMVF